MMKRVYIQQVLINWLKDGKGNLVMLVIFLKYDILEFSHSDFVNCVLVMSNYLLSGTRDGIISLWEINSDKLLKKFQAHSEGVTCLIRNPNDCLEFHSGSIDGTIRTWNIQSKLFIFIKKILLMMFNQS